MRVVHVNYFLDADLGAAPPSVLLDRYATLTGYAEALTAAGAEVTVVQRFAADAALSRGGAVYRFVRDGAPGRAAPLRPCARVNRAVAELRPDVVHVHGLALARLAAPLRRLCPDAKLVAQDHADRVPGNPLARALLRGALSCLDAVSFAARAQAAPWVEAGLLPARTPVLELMEGSSRFRPLPRAEARGVTGLCGDPLCLWVGRLDANKDPLTVLQGFARAGRLLPDARLAMAYTTDALLPAVRGWLTRHRKAAARVRLLGCVPHARLEAVYNSADLLLLGSHHEGSGYAVLEALACGVLPVATDIPSFRVLTDGGRVGALWPVGDAEGLARALARAYAARGDCAPEQVRGFFEERFSYPAIGRAAFRAYAGLLTGAAW